MNSVIRIGILISFLQVPETGLAHAPYVPGEVLVQVRVPEVSHEKNGDPVYRLPHQIENSLHAEGLIEARPLFTPVQPKGGRARTPDGFDAERGVFLLRFKDSAPVGELVEKAKTLPGIKIAEPNFVGSLALAAPDVFYASKQKAVYDLINLEEAWEITTGSLDVIVAVLDSGIDLSHPELVGPRRLPGRNFVDEADPNDVQDRRGHGTRVAGIIGARGGDSGPESGMAGICWEVSLLPGVVSERDGSVPADAVIEALDWACKAGADVINMSLVIEGNSRLLQNACDEASEHAILMAAAGNDHQNLVPRYPAGYDSVISVAAIESSTPVRRAPFSNYNLPGVNDTVDIAAPGTKILSTVPGDEVFDASNGSGTSVAAPIVSGVAALLRSLYPDQSTGAIRAHLERNVSPSSNFVSKGVLDAGKTLSSEMRPILRIVDVKVEDSPAEFISIPRTEILDFNVRAGSDEILVEGIGNDHVVEISVDISHTFIGDLVISVISPDGRLLTLFNREGGFALDINRTFGPFDLGEESLNGLWTIIIGDFEHEDTGVLNAWRLIFSNSSSDGDAALDGGENASIQIELVNEGADLSSFEATLSTDESSVSIGGDTSIFPPLPHGGRAKNLETPFFVRVPAGAAQSKASFQLNPGAGLEPLDFDLAVEKEAPVPNPVTDQVTLSPENTWIVSGSWEISVEGSVTVEPGTTIKFEEEATLEVLGGLSSVGTPSNPIRWLNKTPPPVSLFRRSREFPVGKSPSDAIAVDVNGDGVLDLIATNKDDNNVSVLTGDGNGGFQPERIYSVGRGPVGVAAADMTGDEVLDLITVNEGSGDVSILPGDGSGGFLTESRSPYVGFRPQSMIVVDVIGDTSLDVITTESMDPLGVTILEGDGQGRLQSPMELVPEGLGDIPNHITSADVTGDNILDLIIASGSFDSGKVIIFSGDGNGHFTLPERLPVGNQPRSVVAADVTGDEILDLITANTWDGDLSLLVGEGEGRFLPHMRILVGRSSPVSVVAADVTGDEKLDLITALITEDEVAVLEGIGGGIFLPPVTVRVGTSPNSLIAIDITGDGALDLLTANSATNDLSLLVGGGGRGFEPQGRHSVGLFPRDVIASDVTGDGVLDLITANGGSDDVTILAGEGDGSFTLQGAFSVGRRPDCVIAADLNHDGTPDLVTANGLSNDLSFLRGAGDGSFLKQVLIPAGVNPISVIAVDVTGDGFLDLVTANGSENEVRILTGDGNGGFEPMGVFPVGDFPDTVIAADVTGDGLLDLVTDNYESDNISILMGDGMGGFKPYDTIPVGQSPNRIIAADFTGDTMLDLLTANTGDDSVSLVVGNGLGRFDPPKTFPVGVAPFSVTAKDLNGDGFLDLVTANGGGNDVSILMGDGAGGVLPQVKFPVGNNPFIAVAADLTGDGFLDLVTPNRFDSDVSIYIGDGGGGFSTISSIRSFSPNAVFQHSEFELPGTVLLSEGGMVDHCIFASSVGPGLTMIGKGMVSNCTVTNCIGLGFNLDIREATAVRLSASSNRGLGIRSHHVFDSAVVGNDGGGIVATEFVGNCFADLNEGTGLFSGGSISDSQSVRSIGEGIRADVVENCIAANNATIGIIARQRVVDCTAVSNATGINSPTIINSRIIDTFNSALVGVGSVTDSEIIRNSVVSAVPVTYNGTVISDNGENPRIDRINKMYIAGNEGGGVDGIPVVRSTIIGNRGPGIKNNQFVSASNVVFNEGVGVIGGSVLRSYVKGNLGGDVIDVTTPLLSLEPRPDAPPFLFEVYPRQSFPIGRGSAGFELTWSAGMSTSREPQVSFAQTEPFTTYIVGASPGWISPTTWRGAFSINEEIPDGVYTLRVGNAQSKEIGFLIPPDTYHRFQVDKQGGEASGRVIAEGTESLTLAWDPSANSDILAYRVVSSRFEAGPYREVGAVDGSATNFIDGGLQPATTYFYQIYESDLSERRRIHTRRFRGTTLPCIPFDRMQDCRIDAQDLLLIMQEVKAQESSELLLFELAQSWME